MTLKEEISEIRTVCGQIALGNGKCWVCGCSKAKRGMTIHHRWYLSKGDAIHDQYLPRNDSNVLRYYQDLLPLVKKNPKRFMYLCSTHHQALERFIRFSDKRFNKLVIARKMSMGNKKC